MSILSCQRPKVDKRCTCLNSVVRRCLSALGSKQVCIFARASQTASIFSFFHTASLLRHTDAKRMPATGQTLTLKLGYSHDIKYTLPESLRAFLPEPTLVGLYGIDKNQISQAAASIRRLRPPDAYKGKGIRYEGEKLKLKPGKRK